jgi:hypothetical protein
VQNYLQEDSLKKLGLSLMVVKESIRKQPWLKQSIVEMISKY